MPSEVQGDHQGQGQEGEGVTPEEVKKVGRVVQSLATHHTGMDTWVYSRNTEGMNHLWYAIDQRSRVRRWFEGVGAFFSYAYKEFRREPGLWAFIGAQAYARSRAEDDGVVRPDGAIDSIYFVWEEHADYFECFVPRVGILVAQFLIDNPEDPNAIKIASEIKEQWARRTAKAEEERHKDAKWMERPEAKTRKEKFLTFIENYFRPRGKWWAKYTYKQVTKWEEQQEGKTNEE